MTSSIIRMLYIHDRGRFSVSDTVSDIKVGNEFGKQIYVSVQEDTNDEDFI